jgi:hypothetical protein
MDMLRLNLTVISANSGIANLAPPSTCIEIMVVESNRDVNQGNQ